MKQIANHELVFGIHPIIELLKARKRKLFTLYTTKPTPTAWRDISSLVGRETKIQYVTRDVLTRMAGTTDHQGIVGFAGPFPYQKSFFNPVTAPFLILLDGVQDPRNTGAIIRSSYCTGVSGIILIRKGGADINPTVLKSSAGLAERLPCYQAATIASALVELKQAGYTLYGSTMTGTDATTVTYTTPLCLIIGNEAVGISRESTKASSLISIRQRTPHISYNASVAAGILLFLIAQQTKII